MFLDFAEWQQSYAAERRDSISVAPSDSTTRSICILREPLTSTTSPGVRRQSNMMFSVVMSRKTESLLQETPADIAPDATSSAKAPKMMA